MSRNEIGNQMTRFTRWNRLGTKLAIGLLIVAMFAAIPPAEAYTVGLRITNSNLNVLQNSALWTPYSYGDLMLWPSLLDASYQFPKMVGTIQATTVNDNKNSSGRQGECVSLVKALSKNDVITSDWVRGDNVMTSYFTPAQPGDTIATFDSNGKYKPGHAAIFRSYILDSNGKRIGIKVWDQNYLPSLYGIVARHNINAKGVTIPTDPTNANNYYAIRVQG